MQGEIALGQITIMLQHKKTVTNPVTKVLTIQLNSAAVYKCAYAAKWPWTGISDAKWIAFLALI